MLAHVNLGLLAIDQGQTVAGLERLRWVTRWLPNGRRRNTGSPSHGSHGDVDEAMAAATEAAALAPGHMQYAYRLAWRAREPETSSALSRPPRRVLAAAPDHADARFVEAYALQMTGAAQNRRTLTPATWPPGRTMWRRASISPMRGFRWDAAATRCLTCTRLRRLPEHATAESISVCAGGGETAVPHRPTGISSRHYEALSRPIARATIGAL